VIGYRSVRARRSKPYAGPFEANRLRPVVDRIYPWNEAVEAFRYLEARHHFGKVCLRFT
jgi:NADPH:quinone reductase-like Zn-dependent oxidoreductase